jgi:uncharacterized membrane protein YqgA involved in biofilm formation
MLNVAGILLGGIAGLVRRKPLSESNETNLKVALGALTVFCGLRLVWMSLNGTGSQMIKQFCIAMLAMMVGKLLGQLLKLQALSNHLGQYARDRISAPKSDSAKRTNDGFLTCAALFCAAPLGILGSVQDGLSNYVYPLGIKAVMDGLATMGFVSLFGWGVMLSAVPVLALQGTITLLCARLLLPILQANMPPNFVDSMNAAGGMVVFSVALVILGLKRIQLTEYLPSLVIAPLITWLWR